MAEQPADGEEDIASGADVDEPAYEDGKKDNEACEPEDNHVWMRQYAGMNVRASVQYLATVRVDETDITVNYNEEKLRSMGVQLLRSNTFRVKGTRTNIKRVMNYLKTGVDGLEETEEDAELRKQPTEQEAPEDEAKGDDEDEEAREEGAEAAAAPDGDPDLQSFFTPANVYEMGKKTLKIMQCDITKAPVDAIVNPMGKSFENQGGQVARAILTEAGDVYNDSMDELASKRKSLKKGECVATPLGKTGRQKSFKYVLHTRGPEKSVLRLSMMKEKDIRKAVQGVLDEVDRIEDITSVAIPAIGTGNAGMKPEKAISTLLRAIIEHEVENEVEIYLVSPEQETVKKFVEQMEKVLSGKRDSASTLPVGDA